MHAQRTLETAARVLTSNAAGSGPDNIPWCLMLRSLGREYSSAASPMGACSQGNHILAHMVRTRAAAPAGAVRELRALLMQPEAQRGCILGAAAAGLAASVAVAPRVIRCCRDCWHCHSKIMEAHAKPAAAATPFVQAPRVGGSRVTD